VEAPGAAAPTEAHTLAANPGVSHRWPFFWLTLGDKKFTDRDQLVAFVGLDVKARQSGQSASKRSPSAATVSSLRASIARPKQQSSRVHIACCILVIIGLAHHTETYRL